MRVIRIVVLVAVCMAMHARAARAQDAGWDVNVYPILAWVPIGITVEVDVPPVGGDGGGSGQSLDSQLDGAFFAGVAVSNGAWRFEGYGLWASFGAERPDRPFMAVDLDLIYGSAKAGRRVAPEFYVTGGVRRVAIDYDIRLAELPPFTRKPGVWDPIVGVGWHRVRQHVEWHASFDGGGFGVGADVDLGATVSVDWKPTSHFGLTAGYNVLYLKIKDTVVNRDLTLKATLHGPTVGVGLYF